MADKKRQGKPGLVFFSKTQAVIKAVLNHYTATRHKFQLKKIRG
jgi:hypothetical protein